MSRKGLLLFLACGFAWGIPYFFIRIAVEHFSPESIILVRVVIGSLVLLPLAIKQGALKPALKKWPWILLFAVIEMGIPWLLVNTAQQHIASGLAGLLIATVPFFATLIGYFYMGDQSLKHPKTIAGLLIGFAGIALLVGVDTINGDIKPVWVLAVVAAALGYAIAPAVMTVKAKEIPSSGVNALALAMVAVIYAVPAGVLKLPAEIAANPPIEAWLALGVLGLVCSAIAFILFFALMREVGSARATLITYLNTVVAIGLGVLFLAEPITLGMIIGFPMVLLGSWFAGRKHA